MTPAAMPLKRSQASGPVAVFLLLLALGLLGNYLKFPLFLNIDFIFGGIFAMLALQMLGLRAGMLAGALIASYTLVLWNHPYAALISTAELVVVGILFQRYRVGLVLADALFWLFLGLPLTYLFYHGVMGVPLTNTSLVMSKTAVNGILNALLARLLYMGGALYLRGVLLEYRDLTYNFLAVFALLPAISLLAIQGHVDFAETDRTIRSQLQADGQELSTHLEVWLKNRTSPIVHLASMAAQRTPTQMQDALEQAQASDVNYLRIALVNREAISVALAPLVDARGQSHIGTSYADRPFIPTLRKNLQPMLSDVVLSKVDGGPVALALAPVILRAEYAGYVAGILALDQVQEVFQKSTASGELRYTLLDKSAHIILTNVPEQKAMSALTRSAGTLSPLGGGISQWVPAVAAGAPVMERWSASLYVSETAIGPLGEWTLVLERPVAPFQQLLYARYAQSLGVLLVILLAALVLAEISSRGSLRSLVSLSLMTQALPSRLREEGGEIVWPSTRVAETRQLIANFKAMGDSLLAQFVAVRRSNESLEARVQARTEELQISVRDRDALLKEVHHRVKNNLQVIASLLRMEARRSQHATTRTVLNDMQGRIYAMAQLHESLYRSGTFASVDLGSYLREIASKAFAVQRPTGQALELQLQMGSVAVGMDQAIACGLLVNELVSNCLKHGFPAERSGAVWVELQPLDILSVETDSLWRLSVLDNGVGLPTDFVERSKNSLGLQLVDDLCHQLDGSLSMPSPPGPGAAVSVVFQVLKVSALVMPV